MAREDLVRGIIDSSVIVVSDQVHHEVLALTVIHLRTMVDMVEVSTQINLEVTMVVLLQMIGGEVNCFTITLST